MSTNGSATRWVGASAAVWLRRVVVLVLGVGLACQFVQRTDSTPQLLYFTVDSAVLMLVMSVWPAARRSGTDHWTDRLRGSAVVAMVLSGLVYATVIAPATPSGTWFNSGDGLWVRVATVLLHGVAPVLVVVEFLVRGYASTRPFRDAVTFMWWPISYLVVVGGLGWAGLVVMPYPFLQASPLHSAMTVLAVTGLAITFVSIGMALLWLHAAVRRTTACGR